MEAQTGTGGRWQFPCLFFAALFVIVPCFLFFRVFLWDDINIALNLRLYPEAQSLTDALSEAQGPEGSLERTFYYWTPDTIEQVQEYYSEFAFEFVTRSDHIVTIFNPQQGELPPRGEIEPAVDEIAAAQARQCNTKWRYICIQVRLYEFGRTELVELPALAPGIPMSSTPTPPREALRGGTLIVYSYFTAPS